MRSESVNGGFDEAVVEQSAQASFWLKATVNYVCMSARMKYWTRYSKYTRHTDAKHIQHLKGVGNDFSNCAPDPKMYLHITTPSGDAKFVHIPFEEMTHFVTFESITGSPKKKVNNVNVKVSDSTCVVENVGEFEISSEPEVWTGIEFYAENGVDTREVELCFDDAISKLREEWAKENNYYNRVWTITDVDDPVETEEATLTLSVESEEVEFVIQPPEDITADSPLSNFIQNAGQGLISNVEMTDVYVSFDKVDDKCIATNDIGLSLHELDAKPSLFNTIRSYF